jgi:spore germination protein GerM
MRTVWAVGAALAASVALSGCAALTSDGARPVDEDIAVLLEPQVSPSATGTTAPSQQVAVAWVRGRDLELAERLVPASTRQDELDAALLELVAGPDPLERDRGLTTLLPPDVVLVGDVKRARAVVDLTLTTPPGAGTLPLVVGQIAMTALSVSEVRSVVFTVDGVPTEVPLPRTGDLARVVTERDYRTVLR